MTLPAARIGDMHTCPMVTGTVPHVGAAIVKGEFTVLIGNKPPARSGDTVLCTGPPDTIVKGSTSTLVGNMPQARSSDTCSHGGAITVGEFTVLIG
ncbi:MAG: PAAR domain-containing protein [Pseudomonadota bacterium]